MEQHIGTYVVRDKRGQIHNVDEFQEMVDATSIADARRKYVGGLKRLSLNGQSVNYISDSEFELVATGERLAVVKHPSD